MSQPPYPYNRIFDFESFSIVNPTTQQPGVQIEGELDNVKRTLDSVISRLSEIQRDDGYIRDSALDQSTAIPQFYSRLAILFAPSFALKADLNSPTFTGVVTIPANAVIVGFAKLESPAFTGVPTAPTPSTLSASQQVANAAFVTAADAAIKQFVIDNYLKLDGDQMHDDSVIFWTKETPSQWAPYATGNEKDFVSHSINKDGISLLSEKFELSDDGDTGVILDPANPPHAGEYSEQESFKDKRTTVINPGVIELKEFTQSVHYQSEYVLKGKITIWSGQSNDQGMNSLPIFTPLSGPHMSFWDRYETYGPNPMMISSMGLQFPDGSNQDTRGLSGQEVYDIAHYEANLAAENLIAGAPAALDTLKEIADALANDANLAGTLANSIATKADIVHTHTTSDIIGLDTAINSGKITDYDNFKIYVAGDVVLASNRIYRFNATVGAAGYGPITHPTYWTEQSAAPSLAAYALTTALTAGLSTKANTSHTHTIANITNLQTLLDSKVSVASPTFNNQIYVNSASQGDNMSIGYGSFSSQNATAGSSLYLSSNNLNLYNTSSGVIRQTVVSNNFDGIQQMITPVGHTGNPLKIFTIDEDGIELYRRSPRDGSRVKINYDFGMFFTDGTNPNHDGFFSYAKTAISVHSPNQWHSLEWDATNLSFVFVNSSLRVSNNLGFSDGSLQNTAFIPANYVSNQQLSDKQYLRVSLDNTWDAIPQSDVTAIRNSGWLDLVNGTATNLGTVTYTDGYTGLQDSAGVRITALSSYHNNNVVLRDGGNPGTAVFENGAWQLYLGSGNTLQNFSTTFSNGISVQIIGGSPYVNTSVLDFWSVTLLIPNSKGEQFVYQEELNDEVAKLAAKSGATFTGKVNTLAPTATNAGLNIGSMLSTSTPTSSVAGDVWIGTWQMAYKTANGTIVYSAATNASNVFGSPQVIDTTSNTLPALRVTQKGTQPVLVVEDSLNPDTTALVVDTNGNVGIGVASGYTSTQKVEVVGNVKADGFVNGSGPVFTVKSVSTHANGADTHDIYMSVNGSTYRIPAIFVSTP